MIKKKVKEKGKRKRKVIQSLQNINELKYQHKVRFL